MATVKLTPAMHNLIDGLAAGTVQVVDWNGYLSIRGAATDAQEYERAVDAARGLYSSGLLEGIEMELCLNKAGRECVTTR